MTILLRQLNSLTDRVLDSTHSLDEALAGLENWLDAHGAQLGEAERRVFSAALDAETTDDERSLIDSVLKLHAARLLYRLDARQAEQAPPGSPTPAALEARRAFAEALRASDLAINETRVDIAIANAHHLLGDTNANRRWLDRALHRLPDLAALDLVAQARQLPPLPPPRIGLFKRLGLKVMGINLARLAEQSRDDLVTVAQMQASQVVLLAHLLGVSFEAIRERQRAGRAFRVAAHLIARYEGIPGQEPGDLLDMAEAMQRCETEAAQILARQAQAFYRPGAAPADHLARVQAILDCRTE